ncbi:MAG: hypothetical protein IKU60_03915 [Clostridia bacterium]|nr:hypothetical protein [Clostridia bacterium]
MKCAFFGHSDASDSIERELEEVILNLIEEKEVDTFYVGTHGNFDNMVYRILLRLEKVYEIKFYVVLSAVVMKKAKDYKNTIVPEGIETVPPRFGIDYRNKWMVGKADFVITYVNRSFGGAVKFKEYAEKQKKTVINIV